MPFRKKLPKTSLVSIEDIQRVCPDATNMITRCVETDLRKMAQKITDDMDSKDQTGAKKQFFHFTTVSIGGIDKAGKVGAVSLSGICALTVIADKQRMKEASSKIEDLSEGVWKKEVVVPLKKIQIRTLSL